MFAKLSSRLNYANVVATLALFVALGGSSFAAVALTRNSVKSKHIANGQVKRSDIGRSAVTSPKVKDFSLLARDFRAGDLPAGPPGEQGERGPQGSQGEAGVQGEPGLSGLEQVYVTGVGSSVSPKSTTAICPAGKVVVGGGYDLGGGKGGTMSPNGETEVVADLVFLSAPTTVPGSVIVQAWEDEPTAEAWSVDAIAMCANVAP